MVTSSALKCYLESRLKGKLARFAGVPTDLIVIQLMQVGWNPPTYCGYDNLIELAVGGISAAITFWN